MVSRKLQVGALVAFCFLSVVVALACQQATDRGVSSASFGSYSVTVSPGCQNSSSRSESYSDGKSSEMLSYEFKCGEVTVLIRRAELLVNGKSYGTLAEGDHITVENGEVLIKAKKVRGNAARL